MLKQQEALFKSQRINQPIDSTTIFTQNAMWNALETFPYAPDEDKTFEAYYRRYEDIYITDCAEWTDAKKVQLSLRKLGTVEHNKFVDYILQKKKKKKTCELSFFEIVKLLLELFSSKSSLFHKRWKGLNLTKRDSDDYLGFASVVRKTATILNLANCQWITSNV